MSTNDKFDNDIAEIFARYKSKVDKIVLASAFLSGFIGFVGGAAAVYFIMRGAS